MQQAYGIEDLVKGTSKGTKRCAVLCSVITSSIDLKTAQSLTHNVKKVPFQILLNNKRVIQDWILGLKKLEVSDKRGLRLLTLLNY
jgi:peptidylprolyl isomerase